MRRPAAAPLDEPVEDEVPRQAGESGGGEAELAPADGARGVIARVVGDERALQAWQT